MLYIIFVILIYSQGQTFCISHLQSLRFVLHNIVLECLLLIFKNNFTSRVSNECKKSVEHV